MHIDMIQLKFWSGEQLLYKEFCKLNKTNGLLFQFCKRQKFIYIVAIYRIGLQNK